MCACVHVYQFNDCKKKNEEFSRELKNRNINSEFYYELSNQKFPKQIVKYVVSILDYRQTFARSYCKSIHKMF